MKAILPVIYDPGDFVLSSFRDRVGEPAPIFETEARIERIVAGLRSCDHVRFSSAASVALPHVGTAPEYDLLAGLAEPELHL